VGHGKAINVLRMTRQRKSKVEKTTDKSENRLIPVTNTSKHFMRHVMWENTLTNRLF